MNFKKNLFYIIIIIFTITIVGCTTESKDIVDDEVMAGGKDKLTVAVSIVPQETFVKAVSGNLVDVVTMIPPGNSPANYQPTPKEMIKFSESQVYFSIEVPTEKHNILDKIKEYNKDIKVVPLAKIVSEVYPDRSFCEDEDHSHDDHSHHHDGRDPHIWLSPKRVKVMVEAIKDELIEIDPQNKETYEKNTKEYIAELDKLNAEIRDSLRDIKQKSFIIYHPAFGYFADDYGLKMVTIEKDGKETTSKHLESVIKLSKEENIKHIFYQEEFDSKQAETVAKEIGGDTIKIAPLAPNYIENLRKIVMKFKDTK